MKRALGRSVINGFVVTLSLFILFGCSGPPKWAAKPVQNAKQVEVFWVVPKDSPYASNNRPADFHGMSIVRESINLNEAEMASIQGKFDESAQIGGLGNKKDESPFVPDVILRFHRYGNVVDAAVSLKDSKVIYGPNNIKVPLFSPTSIPIYRLPPESAQALKEILQKHFPQEVKRLEQPATAPTTKLVQ